MKDYIFFSTTSIEGRSGGPYPSDADYTSKKGESVPIYQYSELSAIKRSCCAVPIEQVPSFILNNIFGAHSFGTLERFRND